MRKFLITILFLLISFMPVSALTLSGGVEYTVQSARDLAFQNLSKTYDVNLIRLNKKHISLDSVKVEEGKIHIEKSLFEKERVFTPFYRNGELISYSTAYADDLYHMYYYDKAGCFIAIDVSDKELNVFPHKIAKYNKFGKLVSVAFVVSDREQFIFRPNGKLVVHWKDNAAFDKNGKLFQMTRTCAD